MSNAQVETQITPGQIADANYELTEHVLDYASDVLYNKKASAMVKSDMVELAVDYLTTDLAAIEERKIFGDEYKAEQLAYWHHQVQNKPQIGTDLFAYYYALQLSGNEKMIELSQKLAPTVAPMDRMFENDATIGKDTGKKMAAVMKIHLIENDATLDGFDRGTIFGFILDNSVANITEENIRPRDKAFFGGAHFKMNKAAVLIPAEEGEETVSFENHPIQALITENKETAQLQGIDAYREAVNLGSSYMVFKGIHDVLKNC